MGSQKDFSQLARVLVDHMAGEVEMAREVEADADQESQQVRAGRKGGTARANSLTAAERAAIAQQGGRARWAAPR